MEYAVRLTNLYNMKCVYLPRSFTGQVYTCVTDECIFSECTKIDECLDEFIINSVADENVKHQIEMMLGVTKMIAVEVVDHNHDEIVLFINDLYFDGKNLVAY